MDSQVQRLVEKAWSRYQETPEDQRLLIGIAGIPGSGKSTLAQTVVRALNARADTAIVLPMDGFHLPRAALAAMPDPTTALFRRGAPFTFDAPKFLALVRRLREPVPAEAIPAPSFDHAVKDPREADIAILPAHRIVVAEGLYLALDWDVWRDAAALLDELWFVEVGFDVARKRLAKRHLRAGIVDTLEEGDARALRNDLVNGEDILRCRLAVDEVVESREDQAWLHV